MKVKPILILVGAAQMTQRKEADPLIHFFKQVMDHLQCRRDGGRNGLTVAASKNQKEDRYEKE
jgi:hypothetical protein